MAAIDVQRVAKRFGALCVLEEATLRVEEGKALAVVGPSGSGKTTLLRLVAGLERPDAGVISLFGKAVAGDGVFVPPVRRGVGMVFQDFALWPHMTVERHLEFVLRAQGVRRAERKRRIDGLLDLCRLEEKRQAYPAELSGGQQQRVGIARALATEPRILLLDEPFSNLDPELRERIGANLARRKALGVSVILAVHDAADAAFLADAVVSLENGRVTIQA